MPEKLIESWDDWVEHENRSEEERVWDDLRGLKIKVCLDKMSQEDSYKVMGAMVNQGLL
jgi:hypothetical protein